MRRLHLLEDDAGVLLVSLKDMIELPLGPKGGKRKMTVEAAILLLLERIKDLENRHREDTWI